MSDVRTRTDDVANRGDRSERPRRREGFLRSIAVPSLLAAVAAAWLVIELYGGATTYQGGDDVGPLGRWPDRYHAAWTGPTPVLPRVVSEAGDLRLGDRDSELRINRAADDLDPSITPGGDRLLLASNRPPPSDLDLGGFDLYIATRSGRGFGAAEVLPPPLSTLFHERSPSMALLPDGSARLLFTSNRLTGLATDFDLFIATRTAQGQWHAPVLVATTASPADERGASIHPEGDALVFTRPGARGIEVFTSFETSPGVWSRPERLAGLDHPDNRPVVRYDEGGSALLLARGDRWVRSRLRILHAIPDGRTPWGALILLALALLLLILRALASRWSGLEVLYRCLLISILAHLLLWWWLEDRGLEAPEPTDPGPPAEEIAPIELDPELFARVRTTEARDRAIGEVLPETAPVAPNPTNEWERSDRLTEIARSALPTEMNPSTPVSTPSAPSEMPMRRESTPEAAQLAAAEAPDRAESALADRSAFVLRDDPGHRATESEVTPSVVEAPSTSAAEDPREARRVERPRASSIAHDAPAETTPASIAMRGSETTDSPRRDRPREMTASVATATLDLPARPSPRETPAPPRKAEDSPTEVRERAAPLAAQPGERRAHEARPTPRPTRVRPGPTEAERPVAELSRIVGVSEPRTVGGATRLSDATAEVDTALASPIAAADRPASRVTASSNTEVSGVEAASSATRAESFEEQDLAATPPSTSADRSARTDAPTLPRRGGAASSDRSSRAPSASEPGAIGRADGSDDGAPTVARRAGRVARSGASIETPEARSATRTAMAASGRSAKGEPDRAARVTAGGAEEGTTTERAITPLPPVVTVAPSDGAEPPTHRDLPRGRESRGVDPAPTTELAEARPTPSLGPVSAERANNAPRPSRRAAARVHRAVEPELSASPRRAATTPATARTTDDAGDTPGRPRAAPLRGEPLEELALAPLPTPRSLARGSSDHPSSTARAADVPEDPIAPPPRLAPIAGSPERIVAGVIPPPTVREAETWVPWVSARRGPRKEEALRRGGGNEETEAAVSAGLAYLAAKQRRHGGWGNPDHEHEKYGETSVGRSALALLAFLGAGHAPGTDTEYSALTTRAIDYLLDHQLDRNGHFGAHTSSYSHAIATYALGEATLLGAGDEVRRGLERAVEQILRHQELDRSRPDRYGGWSYYYPDGHRFDEYPRVSISVWQLMALETAVLAGVEVSSERIEAGKRWILQMWSDDLGRYYYNHDPRRLRRAQKTLPASTPAAAFILQVLGHDRDDHRLTEALAMVSARPPRGWRSANAERFLERADGNAYFWYYGTLALFLRGGEAWDDWNVALQRTLLPSQERDGSWRPISPYADYAGDQPGYAIYTTALNVLTLEVYYRYLTPFQKSLTED